ncbi:MAG: S8 family serine peptidase, partial [Erysipelotrichaceae bacterium]|nr:S8 family serine peptidase [Erysipelotrichaceae bacterium]
MKEHSILKKLTALLLTALLVVTGTGVASHKVLAEDDSVEVTFEHIDNEGNGRFYAAQKEAAKTETTADPEAKGGMVRVSIVLDEPSTIGAGYATDNIGTNASAKQYRAGLKAKQDALAKTISKEVLNGEELDVVWNITLAGNIISANVPYDAINEIKTILGVKDVVIETQYSPDVVSTDADDPNMGTATEMVGSNYAWAAGYTGAGSKVAIIDTGLDTDHELFDAEGFDYAIAEVEAEGKTVDLLTADEVAAVWDQLNASAFIPGVDGVYRTTKNPYGVNYVDKDLDITHDNDGQGEHGSHVTGIATANRYVKDENGEFVQSLFKEGVLTQGEAPDAQILTMKVFGKGGGAYDSDYMVAIEDAIVLGADSVNLSLGSANAGQVTNTTYQNILDELTTSATIATMSAGNNYYWTEPSPYSKTLYDDDVNYHTGGSPGSYPASFTSASIDNKGGTGNYFAVSGRNYIFSDGSSASNAPMTSIAGEYEYVFLDGPGVDDNSHVGQDGDTFFALGEEVVAGKVAFCSRGSSSFFAKANAAVGAGAVAVVIYNNQEGTIGMNLTGYSYTAPAVSITQADGKAIKAASTEATKDGITYYTGTITISDQVGVANPGEVEYYVMSDFSSWGVPSDLSLKPEITTPGGNIWSVNGAVAGGKGYEGMSGTSMASPQTAGLIAVFNQYARENGLEEKTGKTLRQLALSMLMSTSKPVEHETKGLYPVMKQGSGLADINAAINAKSYITIDSVAEAAPLSAAKSIEDGKVKIELGEVQDDSFSTTFTLHNFSEEDVEYYLSADFFTQKVEGGIRTLLVDHIDTLGLAWNINGEDFEPADASDYDFNGDGVANGVDAQYLLEWIVGLHEEIYHEDKADIDEDGDVDTYDARLAFETLSNAGVVVEAGADKTVTLTVSGLDSAFGSYVNGNYIEAYIYAQEGETEDGALGVTHSIPLLGFYGNWTDASMYDKMNYIDYYYDYETRNPYLGTVLNAFLIQYPGDSDKYYFGGNPLVWDDEYMPERNAMNSESVISDVEYVQIRNAAGSRFTVNKGTTAIYTQLGGASLGAYYYRNQSQWRNTSASASLGYTPTGMKDGSALKLKYELAPEYYVNEDGTIRWDDLGDGAALTMPFVVDNTTPYIVDVSVEDNTLTVLAHDNQYIAAVVLYQEDGTMINYYGSIANIRKGEQHAYEFDLSDFEEIPAHFLVEVYDYANNLTSYKLNLNTEELDEGLTGLKISPEEALIVKGATGKFTVTAEPWGANEDVAWVSDDEAIATVDSNGIVTAVGKGSTQIRAISVDNPEISAAATVNVKTIETTVFGGVQGADGKPVFYGWDLDNDAAYTALAPLDHDLTAMVYDWNSDDGKYFYQQDFEGYIYKVDADTLEVAGQSDAATAFGAPMEDMDFAFMYNETNEAHEVWAVYGGYFLYSDDPLLNTFSRGMNLSSNLRRQTGANKLVALAWAGINADNYDVFAALDNTGSLWSIVYNGSSISYGVVTRNVVAVDFPVMDVTTGNSMVLGGDGDLYLSHFNGSTNEVYQLTYEDGAYVAYRAGDFGQDVWPAALIVAQPNNSGDDGDSLRPAPSYLTAVTFVEENVEMEDFTPAPEGGLNSVKKDDDSDADVESASTMTIVQIVADQLSKNGMIIVDVPETAELMSWSSTAEHKAWNDKETGHYVFGFVDLEGFELNEPILNLIFANGSTGTVTLTTTDINDDDEQTLTETIILGPATAEHTVHTYGEPVWTWANDNSSATATFTCTLEGHQEVVEAVVEAVDSIMTVTYTATVEFEGKTYTTTKTVDSEAKVLLKQLLLYYTQYRNADGYVTPYTSEADYDIDRILADLKAVDPYLGNAW